MVLLKLFFSSVISFYFVQALPSEKGPRSFSIVNLVQFNNTQCSAVSSTGTTSRLGTCFTADECRSQGGTADGNCAAGFGVCCVFTLETCGGEINKNCTYVTNPGFPNMFTRGTNTMCAFTVNRIEDNICQIRLDFDTLVVPNAPAATGACTGDNFVVASPTGLPIPTLCGTLSGQHMYVPAGPTGNAASFTFNFLANNLERRWNVKVTSIPCGSLALAPDGCLQYFTGLSGNLRNYNFGVLLQSQIYNMCIRQEAGFCSVQYMESSTTMPDPFAINAPADVEIKLATCAGAGSKSFINFGGTSDIVTDALCGKTFGTIADMVVPGSVKSSNANPHIIRLTTNTGTAINMLTGFNLDFRQLPC